ncbi:hypothetical protein NIES2135_45700 [Leptolyngbya boryana NIES-2135]|jgi:hypothetical protein|uniref:Uncharacterized protein n=2 Tax=Leptolyngbya TaxID=47251 RepID=A0A1Z4JLS2_LEPBY|nr:hypothetical protein NIES2135_45700 [Leptolyngbya boryana NIES-2135]
MRAALKNGQSFRSQVNPLSMVNQKTQTGTWKYVRTSEGNKITLTTLSPRNGSTAKMKNGMTLLTLNVSINADLYGATGRLPTAV